MYFIENESLQKKKIKSIKMHEWLFLHALPNVWIMKMYKNNNNKNKFWVCSPYSYTV